MLSENWPLACRASTAPKLPQQSASWVPTHFTHRLTVPAAAALSPPPPATCTYWESVPVKLRAPPAAPLRSAAAATVPTVVPLTPRTALGLPSNGQYDTN